MLLFIWNSLAEWLNNHMLICPSVKYWSMECPGCGMQRSFIALLNGNLSLSLELYPALLPMSALIIYSLLHLKYHFKHGTKSIIVLQIFIVSIISAHYIYKIYTQQIFH